MSQYVLTQLFIMCAIERLDLGYLKPRQRTPNAQSALTGNMLTWVIHMPPLCCGGMKNAQNWPLLSNKWPQTNLIPSPIMQLKHIIVSVWPQGSMMGSTLAGNIPTWVIHMPPLLCAAAG